MIHFIKYAVIRVFGPDRLGLDKALWKSDIGPRLGFPEVSGLPGQRGRPSWENPRTGPVESRGGVPREKPSPKFSPGKGCSCLLRYSTGFLNCSEVHF